MRKYLTTGLFSAILGLAVGAPADAALVSRGFLDEALENYATTTALDLKANQSDFTDLNTEISGSVDVLRQLLEQGGYSYEFVNSIDPEKFPNTISGASFLLYQYLERFAGSILHGWTDSNGTYYAGFADLNNGWTDSEKKTYLGVKGLNDKIGTLPSGNFPGFPESKNLFSKLRQPLTYPTSLAELITAIYGNSETGGPGLLAAIITGFPTDPDGDGSPDKIVGLIPNFWLARDANNLANANATKIGTLPSGNFPGFPGQELLSNANLPLTYPTSLAELMTALYGNSETGAEGLLPTIIAGFPIDTDSDGQFDSDVGIYHNHYLATVANNLANANAIKIGTVPDGYETVGAALTAIKGIAEDAKAAALSAIPDPKAEGSTGKFVLTVDIVGDNATYRWEKIDREGETTTTE